MTHRTEHYTEVRRVLWQVLAANLAVTILKIVLGTVTGALAVVADGFHSLVDSSSNLIGLAAIRLAQRPADERHPYGYRRYETVGALAIGGMLFVAAYEIGKSIVERFSAGGTPELTPLTVILVALTFPVNVLIYTLERRAGERLKSEILLADAAHTRTDLLVTLSVLGSLAGVWLGLPWLDSVVAAGVVVMILRAAVEILRDSAGALTDAVAVDPDQIEHIAQGVPGVLYVHRVRSRGTSDSVFVDLHVKVYSGMSTEQAHAVASEVERQVKAQIPNAVDVLVHIEPAREREAPRWDRIAYDLRQIADGMGLGIHDLHVHNNEQGGYALEMHLEMPADILLGEAHDLAEDFEKRVYAASTRPNTVITHLEPLDREVIELENRIDPAFEAEIRELITTYVGENILELNIYFSQHHANVAVRLCLPAEMPLTEAHTVAENIERDLLTRFPNIYRVTVHVEPRADTDERR
ncbi:MAG: cation diffusion facilitator family transporter [Anaerolineales bacterium]|nr:cation diffusion facilitator family transporter [Anaerolineales bacterium]